MREILFRAKHIHALPQNEHLDGTWVYGYLCDENYINTVDEDEYGGKFTSEMLIDPETVCQYTGLTDKNGRKIFEGDILFHSEVGNIKVQFKNSEFKAIGITHDMFSTLLSSVYKHCDIIGNIFDNTELIGE